MPQYCVFASTGRMVRARLRQELRAELREPDALGRGGAASEAVHLGSTRHGVAWGGGARSVLAFTKTHV